MLLAPGRPAGNLLGISAARSAFPPRFADPASGKYSSMFFTATGQACAMELKYCEKCGQVIALDVADGEVSASGGYVCFDCRTGSGPRTKSKGAPKKSEPLDLFSEATVAVKRKQMKGAPGAKSGPGKAAGTGGQARPKASASKGHPAGAVRVRFRCPDCQTVLQVQGVKKASRMICPKCSLNLFIGPSGVVSKNPPKGVVRKKVLRRAPAKAQPAVEDQAAFASE